MPKATLQYQKYCIKYLFVDKIKPLGVRKIHITNQRLGLEYDSMVHIA